MSRKHVAIRVFGACACMAAYAAGIRAEVALGRGEARLRLTPFEPGANLVPNGSFEEAGEAVPAGWVWEPRNTDAQLRLEPQGAYSGRAAIKVANGTAFGAHVYASLRLLQPVTVRPGTCYTLSAFVKSGSASPGVWIGGGEGWKVRCVLPATGGRWERVSHTFVTGENETSFLLRIVSERPTGGVWLDDVALREGAQPIPRALEGSAGGDLISLYPVEPPPVLHDGRALDTRWAQQRWPAAEWLFCGDELKLDGVASVAGAAQPARVEVVLSDAAGQVAARQQSDMAPGTRTAVIELRVSLGADAPERLTLYARLSRAGAPLACHTGVVNLVTAARVRRGLPSVTALRDLLGQHVGRLEQRGLGAASRVTLTVLDNFVPWVEADLKAGRIDRAWDTLCVLEQMATREAERAGAILGGQAADVVVPRYVTGTLDVSRAQTLGTRRFPDGRAERAPIFFTGYGHFGQVKRDIEKFPGYGCNLIQVEFGPNSVLPSEAAARDGEVNAFLALCDRASRANVAVNLLLSPHYFPTWALDKWPHLKACEGGFFKYCVHDPDARAVIERSLRHVIPRIKDHPALHSVCLSNEPLCVDLRGCRVTAKAWPAWLERRHGAIAVLNARWGTAHADFASVSIPRPDIVATPACLDFVRFNQEAFAAFHGWMAEVVHSMAPDLPVHAKIMMGAHFQKTLHGFWSVDPERFAAFSQYNGNDAYSMLESGGSLWANGWRHCQAGYDFQRSMADLPVFNSENHLIRDRDLDVIPPAHLYSSLWQNAIHGQSSTTLWVWERCNDDKADAAGSILHRPDCVEAVGRCALDLNRLAREVAALQNLAPSVCLLWSDSSLVLGSDHDYRVGQAYEAASFLGQPLGFVTEAKLAAYARSDGVPRPLDSVKVLILPQVTHLPDAAREGLAKLGAAGVRIVVYGSPPEKNDHNMPRDAGTFDSLPIADGAAALFARLTERAPSWPLPSALQLLDASGKPAFGVEIRSAACADGQVASVCNHLREPQAVTLSGAAGRSLTDLITGRRLGPTFTAEPMTPLLVQVR